MKIRTFTIAALAMIAAPLAVQAQSNGGVAAGATTGAVGGAIVGGPVGAVVGGVGGAIVGGIVGEQATGFKTYVVEQKRPSYTYQEDVRVGTALPSSGVQYYEVPPQYGVKNYRYTVVNNRTVLVDPATRKVVQIIE